MLRNALAALLAIIVFSLGCGPTEPPSAAQQYVPRELLPEGPEAPVWRLAAFADYVRAQAPQAPAIGDDDQPNRPICEAQGPPECVEATRFVWFCQDACGRNFWSIDGGSCVDAVTGAFYSCDGFARH